jgi:internalin A
MPDTTIDQRISHAAEQGSSTLDLSGLGLEDLPRQVLNLPNLESLDLSNNKLTDVPAVVFELANLQRLDVAGNNIAVIPDEIGRLFRLRHLTLSRNPLQRLPSSWSKLDRLATLDLRSCGLTALPASVAELTHLRQLQLWDNELTTLPPGIGELPELTTLDIGDNPFADKVATIAMLGALSTLRDLTIDRLELEEFPRPLLDFPELRVVAAYNNRIERLPENFGRLTTLIYLSVSNNHLRELPGSIAQLTRLTNLRVDRNHIERITPAMGALTALNEMNLHANELAELPIELASLKSLKSLDLSDNHLERFPQAVLGLINLGKLDLSGNVITELPIEISRLTQLERLSLQRNRLTRATPALESLARLSYLDLTGNAIPVPLESLEDQSNVKRILAAVGAVETGKRLNEAKILVVGDGKVGKSSVVARLIHDTFDPARETTLGVDINDEIQVTEGRVVDSPDAIRLNIWDFGGQEIQHSTHQFFLTTRSLYLLVVDARKGDQLSNVEYWLKLVKSFGGESPIIVVINQIDQLKGQRELNIDRNALRAKYNVRFFAPVSSLTGEGFPDLRRAISDEVERLDHVRAIWPLPWFRVRQRLKALSADYIPVETYLQICIEEGITDADLRESLLALLHDLGVVIRFSGDTQVLNPRWVTHGVYGLLTASRLVMSQGQFDLKDMAEILAELPDGDRYPPHTHRRLLDVMEHFELCFEFTDRPGRYLIPRHLHDNELDINWDDADSLNFEFQYDTLPDAIVSRFIVRMSQYIEKQYYWKNGVFLKGSADFGQNRAKVKADLVDKKIMISVIGNPSTRRLLLAVIRATLVDLNGAYKIKVGQFTPLPARPEILVSYEALLAHEQMGAASMVVPELRDYVSVKMLLDGIERADDRPSPFDVRKEEPETSTRRPEIREAASPVQANNPWMSGSFYVMAFVVVVAALIGCVVVLSRENVSAAAMTLVPVIVIAALLAVGVIGAVQLRNDDRLSEKSFLQLIVESYKRMSMLRGGDAVAKGHGERHE